MTSWHEPRRDTTDFWVMIAEFVGIAIAVPVMFFGLDALLLWIAGWFA